MKLYDFEKIFKVNKNLTINFCTKEWGNYVYVEDFWENPEDVQKLFFQIPCIIIPSLCYLNYNGEKYFDGRNHFCFPNKPEFSFFCLDLIQKYFKEEEVKVKWNNPYTLFGNVFQMFDEKFNDYKTSHYAPHVDGKNQYACTWYMNKYYEEGEGTSIYNKSISSIRDFRLNKSKTPWTNKIKKVDTIQAKYNSMSIYDGSIPHGQSLSSLWFKDKRLSLVQFFEVLSNEHRN